jgi:eukaryotic-like serine/threonine-protein kinase
MAAVQREFADGEVVPGTRYRVMRPLGAGGMGSVYLVEHVELGKRFVLKALFREFASRKDLVARLRQEWRSLARLDNPNIINVTDAGTSDNGVPFYVMERVEGETLSDILTRDHTVGIPRAIAIATSVLEGLSAAHEIGIVHRDVKPPNIFVVAGGGVKLLDFGIAKLADQNAEVITARGLAIGTPRYMSPEQARGKAVDARADLYAVGLVLYEMITGEGPFDDARDANELLLAHLTAVAPVLSTRHRAVDPALDDLVARLLAKEPDARPKSAREAAAALRGLLLRKQPTPIVQTPTQRMGDAVPSAAPTKRVGPVAHTGPTLIQAVPSIAGAATERTPELASTMRSEERPIPRPAPAELESTEAGMEWARDGFNTHVSAGPSEELTAVPNTAKNTLRLGDAPIAHPADVPTRTAVPFGMMGPEASVPPLAETPPPVAAPMRAPARTKQPVVAVVLGASLLAIVVLVVGIVAMKALGGSHDGKPTAAEPPPPAVISPPAPAPVEPKEPEPAAAPNPEPAASGTVPEAAQPQSPVAAAETKPKTQPKPAEPKAKPAETQPAAAKPPPAEPAATKPPKGGKLPSSGL